MDVLSIKIRDTFHCLKRTTKIFQKAQDIEDLQNFEIPEHQGKHVQACMRPKT